MGNRTAEREPHDQDHHDDRLGEAQRPKGNTWKGIRDEHSESELRWRWENNCKGKESRESRESRDGSHFFFAKSP